MPVGDINHGNQSFNILFNNTGGGNKICASYDDALAGAATKAALIKFQKANALPVGQLDYETLRALGIK